jgi:hypothetical protein
MHEILETIAVGLQFWPDEKGGKRSSGLNRFAVPKLCDQAQVRPRERFKARTTQRISVGIDALTSVHQTPSYLDKFACAELGPGYILPGPATSPDFRLLLDHAPMDPPLRIARLDRNLPVVFPADQ